MSVTRQARRMLACHNKRWPPALVKIPPEQWPAGGVPIPGITRKDALRSREFLVQVFDDQGHVRLSVNRTEWDVDRNSWREDISWNDLQRLKAECGFAFAWAVEVFPPVDNVINVASMRHLWLLAEPPAYGWHGRSALKAKAPDTASRDDISKQGLRALKEGKK